MIFRYAGAIGYSQPMNTAAVGASLASAEIHRSQELTALQGKLASNIELFDSLVPTPQAGTTFPIRFVNVTEADVVRLSVELFRSGYYVSPIFFPVVAKGKAGLRVMMRAGQTHDQIRDLSRIIKELTVDAAA